MNVLLLLGTAWAGSIQSPGVIAGPDSGPATPDPAAIYYNPAAIGALQGAHGMMDVQAAFVRVDASATRNDGINPNTGSPYGLAKARVVVPVALLASTFSLVPDRLAIGVAVTQPFTGGGDWTAGEANSEGPFTAHQRYASVKTRVMTFQIQPALAVTVKPGVHVGLGAGVVVDHLSAIQASDPLGTEGRPIGTGEPYSMDSLLTASGTGAHFSWNAGLFIDKCKYFQVGASFSGAALFHAKGTGTVALPETLQNENYSGPMDTNAEFTMPLPGVVRVSLASELNKVRVGAGFEYYYWNVAAGDRRGDLHIALTDPDGEVLDADDGSSTPVGPDLYSPRRLWNATNVNATVAWKPNKRWWMGARLAWNQYAVPDYAVTASNLDFTNLGGMVGMRVRVAGPLTLGLSYTKFFPLTRTITTSAWDIRDPGAPGYVDERFSPQAPFKASANGVYEADVDIIGLRIQIDK